MKNIFTLPFWALCAVTLLFSSCTLDEEPEIPEGHDNIENPDFQSSEIIPNANNTIQASAVLATSGNLNIVRHGWVWGQAQHPTVQDDSLDLGRLITTSFSAQVSGLALGTVYFFRPYASTSDTTIYGEESCTFLGVNFSVNTGTGVFKGGQAQFTNSTPGNCTFQWDFGDGGTSTDPSPAHIFNEDTGSVTVKLTADIDGCKVSKSMKLVIFPDPFLNYLVPVPGGNFMMGCTAEQNGDCDSDEEYINTVSVPSFYMGRSEITQGQWIAVMGENPSIFNTCGLNCPVENVTWNDVQAFIVKLNATLPPGAKPYRLPTEAEWEYAARGNQPFKYAGSDDLDSVAWHMGNSGDSTHVVMTKSPNAFQLYDMSGNVYEYVEDYYHESYEGAPLDGTAWLDMSQGTQRVQRSGGWRFDTNNCRTANRGAGEQWDKDNVTGFRLARSY